MTGPTKHFTFYVVLDATAPSGRQVFQTIGSAWEYRTDKLAPRKSNLITPTDGTIYRVSMPTMSSALFWAAFKEVLTHYPDHACTYSTVELIERPLLRR